MNHPQQFGWRDAEPDLEAELEQLRAENLALAIQVKQQREFLEFAWRDIPMNEYAFEELEKTLAQPDNSDEIIKQHDIQLVAAAQRLMNDNPIMTWGTLIERMKNEL